MALTAVPLVRVFKYQGMDLPDVSPTMSPEQVRDSLTPVYPDLATAAVEGPVMEAGRQVFTFVRAVRDKGATVAEPDWLARPLSERLEALNAGDMGAFHPGAALLPGFRRGQARSAEVFAALAKRTEAPGDTTPAAVPPGALMLLP